MAFWWVFQGDSYKRAKAGGYLWAPQKGKNGRSLFHWTNMTKVVAGDIIFSGYDQELVAISIASEPAFESDPPTHQDVPKWPSRGWKINVALSELTKPIPYEEIIPDHLAEFPDTYSPFSKKTAEGNMGYLFAVPDAVGESIINLIEQNDPTIIDRVIATEYADKPNGETVRKMLQDVRIGQGKFRSDLDTLWKDQCAVTSLKRREFLRGSHIKSWASSNNEERLNPYNGLLLSVVYDTAFDKLLITFDESGAILLAPDFSSEEALNAGINPNARLRFIDPKHKVYLAQHREVFQNRADKITMKDRE